MDGALPSKDVTAMLSAIAEVYVSLVMMVSIIQKQNKTIGTIAGDGKRLGFHGMVLMRAYIVRRHSRL